MLIDNASKGRTDNDTDGYKNDLFSGSGSRASARLLPPPFTCGVFALRVHRAGSLRNPRASRGREGQAEAQAETEGEGQGEG